MHYNNSYICNDKNIKTRKYFFFLHHNNYQCVIVSNCSLVIDWTETDHIKDFFFGGDLHPSAIYFISSFLSLSPFPPTQLLILFRQIQDTGQSFYKCWTCKKFQHTINQISYLCIFIPLPTFIFYFMYFLV